MNTAKEKCEHVHRIAYKDVNLSKDALRTMKSGARPAVIRKPPSLAPGRASPAYPPLPTGSRAPQSHCAPSGMVFDAPQAGAANDSLESLEAEDAWLLVACPAP